MPDHLRILLHNSETASFARQFRDAFPKTDIAECNSYDDLTADVDRFKPDIVYLVRFAGTPGFPRDALFGPGGPRWVANGGAGTDHFGQWDPSKVTVTNAAGVAADMMADLRTGHLVGATPRKQQMVELMTTWLGPIVCMGTLVLIASVNMKSVGVPLGPGTDTAAPQAQALQAVIMGVRGGDMPYALYGLGGALGMLHGLGGNAGRGVLVGLSMYLPFIFSSTYGIGCGINILASTVFGKRRAEEYGVPLAAGFIVGESLLALGINIIVLAMG